VRGAISSVPTLDTATAELIAMGCTVRFFAAFDATAAVTRAQVSDAGVCALSVLVALVTNLSSLVAAVCARGARVVVQALLQAAIAERVAGEPRRTI
jgi:hypothetical protein